MTSLLKFDSRHCIPFIHRLICLGLTLLPLTFIVHELNVIAFKTESNIPTRWEMPVVPHLPLQVHDLNWRESLLRELKTDLDSKISGNHRLLSCRDVDTIDKKERLGRGVTKDVYRGLYRGRSVAVKMVTDKVEDIKACWRRNKHQSKSECYVYANYKLLKEMALTMQLDHQNIVKVECLSYYQSTTVLPKVFKE